MEKGIQLKFATKEQALRMFDELKKTHKFVSVIESKGEFFVETEPQMIRTWETLIKSTD